VSGLIVDFLCVLVATHGSESIWKNAFDAAVITISVGFKLFHWPSEIVADQFGLHVNGCVPAGRSTSHGTNWVASGRLLNCAPSVRSSLDSGTTPSSSYPKMANPSSFTRRASRPRPPSPRASPSRRDCGRFCANLRPKEPRCCAFSPPSPCSACPFWVSPKEIQVSGNQAWVDTGIDVNPGDLLRYEASGTLKFADAQQAATPEGLARGWKDLIRILPLNDAGRGAVIGRIGSGSAARAFLIGARRESRALVAGRLFVGINQAAGSSAEGAFQVRIEIAGRATDAADTFTGTLPPITDTEFSQIPRRVVDKDKIEGDRVNFLILGTEEQVKQALLSVGWWWSIGP